MDRDIGTATQNQTGILTTVSFYYDKNGRQLPKHTEDTMLIKRITNDQQGEVKSKSFSVRFDNQGKLYNPYGMYNDHPDKRNLGFTKDFRKVTEAVYKNYMEYLRTKNQAWLTNAERGLI